MTPDTDLLDTRGLHRALDAYVTATLFDRGSEVAAFALGDGSVRLVARGKPESWHTAALHDGSVLALAADIKSGAFLTGGDDGRLRRLDVQGTVEDLADYPGKWVDHIAVHADRRAGLVACAVGRTARLLAADGAPIRQFDHPSTVTGLAFDAKGKRLGASHYGGASLWFVGSKDGKPRLLEWKGSHTGVAIHPGGDALVTAMQENALHGWRLQDDKHMRMSGYPAKCESLSFSRSGKWLASSGADGIVLWPFFAGGPIGKPPVELAGRGDVLCTRVACHPSQDVVAAGYADGMVLMAEIGTERLVRLASPNEGPVTALAWSPDGATLAFGTEQGFAALIDLSAQD